MLKMCSKLSFSNFVCLVVYPPSWNDFILIFHSNFLPFADDVTCCSLEFALPREENAAINRMFTSGVSYQTNGSEERSIK